MPDSDPQADYSKHRLPSAGGVVFDSQGTARSSVIDDIFYSKNDGLAESRFVFMQSGAIVNAWQDRDFFVIGELGFGTGLNFLAVWDAWRNSRKPGAILHFVSVEGYLLPSDQVASALAPWAELGDLVARLLARWPKRAKGFQRLWFPDDGICLTLIIDQVVPALKGLHADVDAWFLDGFAPSRNADMWTPAVFAQLARLSKPRASLATYTVAGDVRRGLTHAGFELNRLPGFGSKRERLTGTFTGAKPILASLFPNASMAKPPSALVIGGGIAAACTVYALQKRGIEVVVIDDDPQSTTKASGNRAALLMPRLDRGDTAAARFFRAAHLFALDTYSGLPGHAFCQVGVVEKATSAEDVERLNDLIADPPLPPDLLEAHKSNALLHCGSGSVRPDRLCPALMAGASSVVGHVVELITRDEQWQARDASGEVLAEASLVILANGAGMTSLLQCDWLPIKGSLGQVSFAACHAPLPTQPLSDGAYALAIDGELMFGATFDPVPLPSEPGAATKEAHERNRALLRALAPAFADAIDMATLTGRASIRATTADRLPLAGPLPDIDAYMVCNAGLAEGKKRFDAQPAPQLSGLYALGGLGARGFSTAPLCAEIVVSTALGEPLPVDLASWEAVQPTRFAIRALKRKQAIIRPKRD
jgi:tRNA 5-methylaminomethyl-2-thiouridine biosynthesis bifunctional protein